MNTDEVKKKIISIYPNAIMVDDTHNYGSLQSWRYILLSNPPKGKENDVQDGRLSIDYKNFWTRLEPIHLLSDWHSTEDECWLEAWTKIEKKTLDKLDE